MEVVTGTDKIHLVWHEKEDTKSSFKKIFKNFKTLAAQRGNDIRIS